MTAASAVGPAPTTAPKPAKTRRCANCKEDGHRADNSACPKYAVFEKEKAQKRKAAAAAAAAAAAEDAVVIAAAEAAMQEEE